MLADLIKRPVIVAPMAGGPTTPGLIAAAASAGALGFLAAGYKTAAAMRAEIDAVTAAARGPFGVNVFVPGAPAGDRDALDGYLASIAPDARAAGTVTGAAIWEDDDWDAKVADLIARPVPVVSFTFGCPAAEIVAALRTAGSSVWITVTDQDEAERSADAGADCLCVQGPEAGAHRGTFTNDPGRPLDAGPGLMDLVAAVRAVTGVPLVAAGGIMDAKGVAAVLESGAIAAQCGTAFLRSQESGANPAYKAALADPRFTGTAVTRAFSGRPARGLVNRFMVDHRDAPAAYPEINNATRPIRAAAAASGDANRLSLWAGQGYRAATTRTAGEIVALLCDPAD